MRFLSGNEAIAEAAVRAGCRAYFGYPITPQTELLEYMARRLPEVGGVFLQAESEVAAINMVYGASGAGVRAMTSSSGPGISLMAEGFSFLVGAELPAVIVNMSRTGPGLGGVTPSQQDYFLATRAAGHGDSRLLTLAPWSCQEAADLTYLAFFLADRYRHPVMVMGDGLLAQMREPVVLPPFARLEDPDKPWATRGRGRGERRIINSLRLDLEEARVFHRRLREKYREMEEREVRFQGEFLEDASLVVVAYGIAARVARRAVFRARSRGIPAGLFRPVSLWPFPRRELRRLAPGRRFLVVELSQGQLWEDVCLAVGEEAVSLLGEDDGSVPSSRQVEEMIIELTRVAAARAHG